MGSGERVEQGWCARPLSSAEGGPRVPARGGGLLRSRDALRRGFQRENRHAALGGSVQSIRPLRCRR